MDALDNLDIIVFIFSLKEAYYVVPTIKEFLELKITVGVQN